MTDRPATLSPQSSGIAYRAAAAVVGELIHHQLTKGASAAGSLLSRLDEAVRTYEVEFRGYLNGQRPRPPLELGAVLSTAFSELAAESGRGAAGFRVDALEARFHAARRLLTQRLERADRRLPARLARIA